MKFNKISIYALLIAGIGISSCNTDELDGADTGLIPVGSIEGQMAFKATMGKSLSKSTVSCTTGKTKFSADDHIKVFTLDGTSANFANANADEGEEAWFTGNLSKSNGYYAVLPYQDAATISEKVMSLNLPTTQTSEYEDLMVGYTTEQDHSFQFKHVGAMIRFTPNRAYSKIKIETTDGTKIAGDIQVTVSQDGSAPVVSGGTSSVVTLEREMEANDTVFVTLMPTTIAAGNLKVTFYRTGDKGGQFTHTIYKNLKLESGVIYTYGNIGPYKVSCYKDEAQTKEIFSIYLAEYANSHQADLPQLPSPEEGKLYGYSKTYGGTTATYKNHIKLTDDKNIILYPVLVDGVTVTIYNNGNDNTPTTVFTYPSVSIKLPEITAQAQEGYGYVYTDGNRQYETTYTTKSTDTKITLKEIQLKTVNYYVNGKDAEPTTITILPTSSAKITLPTLPEKSGYFAGYTTSSTSDLYDYFQGQTIYASNLNSVTNYYPVYRPVQEVTSTVENHDYKDMTLGAQDLSASERLSPESLAQIAPGTSAVFKFTHYCTTTESLTSNTASIRLCGANNANSSLSKEFMLNPEIATNSKYSNVTSDLQSSNFMENLNETEVTVTISNRGGIADIELSWIGSDDNKTNSVKYSNICIWDDLYVTFAVNKAYIVLQ
ncbi:MAG: fimbrillin family protein [Bacteroidales bacterium]|nr:fimbrillin family protein [Bacteroidales bacterium]